MLAGLTHSSNSSDFTVNAVGNRKAANYQYYFLEGKLELLDSENSGISIKII